MRNAPFLAELSSYQAEFALHPVAVDTWGGFIFARLHAGRGAAPLAAQLGGTDGGSPRYPLADLRSRAGSSTRSPPTGR